MGLSYFLRCMDHSIKRPVSVHMKGLCARFRPMSQPTLYFTGLYVDARKREKLTHRNQVEMSRYTQETCLQ